MTRPVISNWSSVTMGTADDKLKQYSPTYKERLAEIEALDRELAQTEARRGAHHRSVAALHVRLGELWCSIGSELYGRTGDIRAGDHLHAARQHFERTLVVRARIYGGDHEEIAETLKWLGTVHCYLGWLYPEYWRHAREAVDDPQYAAGPAASVTLAVLRQDMVSPREAYETARQYRERELAMRERLHDSWPRPLAWTLKSLGLILIELGDLPAAVPHLERALAICEQDNAWLNDFENRVSLDQTGANSLLRHLYSDAFNDHELLGYLHEKLGDLPAARHHFACAFAIQERARNPYEPSIADTHINLGRVLHALGDLDAARQHFERAIPWYEAYGRADSRGSVVVQSTVHNGVSRACRSIATVLRDQGDLPAARTHLLNALVHDEWFGPDRWEVADDHCLLARVNLDMGDVPAARQHIARAFAIDPVQSAEARHRYVTRFCSYSALDPYGWGSGLQIPADRTGVRQHYARALAILEALDPPPQTLLDLVRGALAALDE